MRNEEWWCGAKNKEAPQNYDSVSRHCHRKRWQEISMAHCGQYHRIGTVRESMPWCYVFLLSHMRRLSDCKKDFSLALEMTIRESDQPPVTSH